MGRFSVDYARGCAPHHVNISEHDNFDPSLQRQYRYEGPDDNESNDTTHIYTISGTYQIIQTIQNANPETDTLVVEVLEATIPTYEIYSCSNNAARIAITDTIYDYYQIFYNNDSVRVQPNTISPILNFPNSNNQPITIRGYYENAADNCGEINFVYAPIAQIAQPVINSATYHQDCVDIINATLDVTINNSVRHQVAFSTDSLTFQVIDTVYNNAQIQLNDLSLTGSTAYFRVSAIDECTGDTSLSGDFAIYNIPNEIEPIENIHASYLGKAAVLTWVEPGFNNLQYNIWQSRNGAPYTLDGQSNAATYTSTGLNPDFNTYQFQIIAEDSCGNQSTNSITATPTYLSFEHQQGNFYNIFWNDYQGWVSGVNSYQFQTLSLDGAIQDEFTLVELNEKLLNISNLPGNRFRIRIVAAEGSYEAYSNVIALAKTKTILIPDAFTPNGDGLNDEIAPILDSAQQYEFLIYNKWGELIFRSDNHLIGWDGSYKNGTAAEGTYIYRIKYQNEFGELFEQSGTFILMR